MDKQEMSQDVTDNTNEITPEEVKELLDFSWSPGECFRGKSRLKMLTRTAYAYLQKCEELEREKTINNKMLNNIERLLETNQRLLNQINKANIALIGH